MPVSAALMSSSVEHWLTPPSFLDLVREVYDGTIDADYASNRASQVGSARALGTRSTTFPQYRAASF